MTALTLTQEWDKTFPKSERVNHGKVTFHNRYFSEYAFEKMTGKHVEGVSAKVGNKELYIIPGTSHVDLYDDVAGIIPYDKMEAFFRENLK